MGNQRFKLSNMIPNAWFHKLKDMSSNNKSSKRPSRSQSTKLKYDHLAPPLPPPPQPSSTAKTTNDPPLYESRKSYHITRELINPSQELDSPPFSYPRRSKSSTKSRKSSRRTNSISSSSCKSSTTFHSYPSKSNSPSPPPVYEDVQPKKEQKTEEFKDYDIVINVEKEQSFSEINSFHYKLSPIITKQETKPLNLLKEEKIIPSIMKERNNINPSPGRYQDKGVRLKVNSPRILGMKQGHNRNNSGRRSTSSKKRSSISESFAVVKSSFDPQKDFKESMMEMIVQNNLSGSKDLEDLLACYLSLNSDEYHDVIIKVFKQIWFNVRHQQHIA